MGSFKTLKDFFAKYKWRYIIGVIWLIFVDVLQLILPRILKNITDSLQSGQITHTLLLQYSGYVLVIGLGIAVGRFFWRIYIQGTSRLLEYHLRNKLFRHFQSLSTNFFNKHKTGDLMAHATNDINAVRMALGPGVVMVTDAFFITISAFIMMLKTTNIRLTLLALLPLPFLAFTVTKFGKMIHNRFKIVQEAFSKLTDKVQESFSGIRVVKSYVQEEADIQKFTTANKYNFDMNVKLVRVWGLFFPLVQFISALSFILIMWVGGIQVISGSISLGDFVAFNSYLGLLVWPMMAIGWVINLIQRGAASMERINKILNQQPEITDSKDVLNKTDIEGNIEFKNVSFKYPDSNTYSLRNINLKIEKGKTLAIVGRTGSGKTTIVNLLLRLYNVNEGKILIDEIDINKIPLKTLRENIGYVSQNNFLFSSTIKENIAFAFDGKIDDQLVINAAKISEIYDNIMDFPKKFNTVLGERGVTLSGGQKQRTAIARAIIKNPSILILDDSLSAVDTQTEEKILNNLKDIMKTRTTILIAHRISTVKKADEIIVLNEGVITERGTHEQLLQLNGLYKDIYEKQLLEEKIENE